MLTFLCRNKQTEIKIASRAARMELAISENTAMFQSLLFTIKYFLVLLEDITHKTEFKDLSPP